MFEQSFDNSIQTWLDIIQICLTYSSVLVLREIFSKQVTIFK